MNGEKRTMPELEKIERYIRVTNIPSGQCRFPIKEGDAIGSLPHLHAICVAFSYGAAKGWRAPKRAGRPR